MQSMAKQMNLPKLNQIMMEFVKENEKMETQQELIGDSIDDVMEGDADEEEEDKIVGQVLDEIGIDLTSAVPEAPSKQAAQPQAVCCNACLGCDLCDQTVNLLRPASRQGNADRLRTW